MSTTAPLPTSKPAPLTVQVEGIPQSIQRERRWVVWNYNWDEERRRWTKVPYRATQPTRKASSTNPTTWSDFAAALGAFEDGKADGVGFVLGDGFVGVDLDHMLHDGVLEPEAQATVNQIGTYAERSVGGEGVHLLGRGILPRGSRKRGNVECYDAGRFFTVTGHRLPNAPVDLLDVTDVLVPWHTRVFGPGNGSKRPAPSRPATHCAPRDETDDVLLERARTAKNGNKFAALWAGDTAGYPSASEADLALCNALAFWTDADGNRMDRLFRRSGLMREKWDERHGERTYGAMTLTTALAGCHETYTGGGRRVGPAAIGHDAAGVRLDDFNSYMPMHTYIFAPTCEMWPAASVNARLPAVTLTDGDGNPVLDPSTNSPRTMKPAAWLDRKRPVEQMTWVPGQPRLIRDRLVSEGGWIDRAGVTTFNLYRPPQIGDGGDPTAAVPWLDHVRRLYPDHADHIVRWAAHRVQRPGEKVNHALVLGGSQGIGKDTLLEPVKYAVGPWNFAEVSPGHLLGRFNGFVKSVILRVSEARDLGDVDRYAFYEHLKIYTAAPPDVLRVDEKNLREYAVWNVCGVVLTTNHKIGGLYLPADDRRHYVAWTDLSKDDFSSTYWTQLYAWYDGGGNAHVAAYLRTFGLSTFDPKAPPPKTAAFWDLVDNDRAPEDAELADALDYLDRPAAVTIADLSGPGNSTLGEWLRDRKNARQVPHRMEKAGYVSVRNTGAKDGMWKLNGRRQVVYARAELSERDRLLAAHELGGGR